MLNLFAEVVQGESSWQVEQPGAVWQADVREAAEGSAIIQADHSLRRQWEAQGSRLSGAPRTWRTATER